MPKKIDVLKVNTVKIVENVNDEFILSLLKNYEEELKARPSFIPYYRIVCCFEDLGTNEILLYCYLLNKINIERSRVTKDNIKEEGGYLEWFHNCIVPVSYVEIAKVWRMMSERVVRKSLDNLEDLGFITTVEIDGRGKKKTVKCNYDIFYEIPVQLVQAWVNYRKEIGLEIPEDIKKIIREKFREVSLFLNSSGNAGKNSVKNSKANIKDDDIDWGFDF